MEIGISFWHEAAVGLHLLPNNSCGLSLPVVDDEAFPEERSREPKKVKDETHKYCRSTCVGIHSTPLRPQTLSAFG